MKRVDKYLARLEYLHELIEKEITGPPHQLAQKIGISRRMIYYYLEHVKFNHREIVYCRRSRTYKYL
jgi:transcriptional antiterminator